jgi:hypothetical membrane protein
VTYARTAARAGIIGPLLFGTAVVVQGAVVPEYSHVRLPISALAAWPTGWIQDLSFYLFGALTVVFAIGLHRAVRPTRHGGIGFALLVMSGIGLIMSGAFSWKMVDGLPRETAPHILAAVIVFAGTGLALMTFSRRLLADSYWRDLATYTLGSGIAVLLLFLVTGVFAIGDGTPLHPWAGLLQRVVCAVWFACLIALALRLHALGTANAHADASRD